MAIRLDKYLADMQIGTRSEVKKLIGKGHVSIDGVVVKKADTKIDESTIVYIDDQPLEYVSYEYYLLNKPQGYVTATEDQCWPVVMDLVNPIRKDLAPVGRLDKDTEGVLLITNDGMLAHLLISPKSHVDKVYYAEVEHSLPENAKELFAKGMHFKDFDALPAQYEQITDKSAYLTIHEGKFHQVKRMFEQIGTVVTFLRRVKFGPLELTGLPVGEYRELTEQEIAALKESVNEKK